MKTLTITEALAEINLLNKKITSKEQTIMANLSLAAHLPDPFKHDGGAQEFINKELQAVGDLQERLVRIRAAIAHANLENTITLGEQTRSIFDWLTWRREVSQKQVGFLREVVRTVKEHQDKEMRSPSCYKLEEDGVEKVKIVKFLYPVDYAVNLKKQEKLNDILEELDGKLSLKNATITVEV